MRQAVTRNRGQFFRPFFVLFSVHQPCEKLQYLLTYTCSYHRFAACRAGIICRRTRLTNSDTQAFFGSPASVITWFVFASYLAHQRHQKNRAITKQLG